jgi:hypothetical protein
MHPFFLSVTDLKYQAKDKSLEVSVRIFANDLEAALVQVEGKSVDLFHPKDKPSLEKLLERYLKATLLIKVNEQDLPLQYIGHEFESESCWIYLAGANCPLPKSLEVQNMILYNKFKTQSNIVQIEVGSEKKSARQSFPGVRFFFEF